jgi:hypothetical protein
MSKITAYTAITAPLTDCVVPIVDVHDTTQAASGTTKKVTLANLIEAVDNDTDTNIKQCGAQASGTVNAAADAGHVHPAANWIPSDNGMLAVNFPPALATSTFLVIAGSLYLQKIWIRAPFTATNLLLSCSTAGAGASTTSFCGLWNSSGTLLTGSADIGSSFTSTGLKSLAFTTPQALTISGTGGFAWAGFVFNMATTQPTLRALASPGSSGLIAINLNLSNATLAACINGTAVTSLSSITPSSNTQGGTQPAAIFTGIT